MNVLVFGGSGFLGSHVAEELAAKKYRVIVVDGKKINFKNKNIKFVKADILNIKDISKLFKKIKIVYNFAAIADIGDSYSDPLKTLRINILGNANILSLCAKYKIKRYVFASSIYVYSEQGGFYRASKQSSEIIIKEFNRNYKLPFTILRYGSIYGPRTNIKNGLYKIIYDALIKKKLIYRGTRKAVRSYIHVKDAAYISVEVLKKNFKNKSVLVRGKRLFKISELLQQVGQILDIKSEMYFLNQTQKGHYDKSPFVKKKKENVLSLYPKRSINFKQGIQELISEIKIISNRY